MQPIRRLLRLGLTVLLGSISGLALAPLALGAEAGGTIEGMVTAEKGVPKAPVEVVVFHESGGLYSRFTQASTDVSGKYVVKVPAGTYKLEFVPSEKLRAFVYYKGRPTLAKAQPVPVAEGTTVTADEAVEAGDKIFGHVKGEGAGPLVGATVNVYSADGQLASTVTSGAEGDYEVEDLPPEEYVVQVFEPTGAPFAPGYFQGKLSFAAASKVIFTTPQEVQQPIDVALTRQAVIEGTVTNSVTHQPITGVTVSAVDPIEPNFNVSATTDSQGKYSVANLPRGSFQLTYALYGGAGPIDYAPIENSAELTVNETLPRNIQLVPQPPSATVGPVASGTPTVGQPLSCASGAWSGPPPIAFLYRWLRDGVPITAAAPANTYLVQGADQGHALRCEVIASTSGGEAAARSNALNVVLPVGAGTAKGPPPGVPLPLVTISSSKVVFVKRVASASLSCSPVGACVGTVKLTEQVLVTRLKGKKVVSRKRKTLLLATGSFDLKAGRAGRGVLHLTEVGKTWLAISRGRRLPGQLVASVHGGATARRTVVFSEKAPRKHK